MKTISPSLIKTSHALDEIAEQRIKAAIRQSGKEIERFAPKNIESNIKDLYKIPFRPLVSFKRNKYSQLKRKLNQFFKS